ncbi:hypothetical protein EMIHUDRAFT_441368 [Emiliania huxleyi CCMP1516]|uniref:Uncharacterized protein n=2 Tax=Emiliania huxleyi TaxID=2903 RepID=A0A0D3KE84_EMIH1|nr:hypothetical protein EMIHUDRAFT_441368 [Emiliania huxleyi CCMP1516]EOD34069.1 hypothetical protein EMIHUDRAFT_441368 [Emiliania huxleyi CCMP1516]|eukprot:XP_005786498.1 hypothetical protein EMIHUDRAFT_441368 [Emiliania huxleyi CCMP1516]
MQVIEAFNQNGLYFLLFALCLDADSIPETTRFVAGRRAKTETYSAKYIYTWVLLLGMWLLVVALKFYFTMLFLWLIPLLVLIYGTALHAYPYLFAGVAACPPHAGPAVEMAGICTLLAFLLVFCGYRACWLFPCPAGSSSRQTSRPTTPSGATSTSRPSASCSTTWASPGRRTASGSRPAGRPCAGRGYRRSCAQSARGDSQTLLLRRKYLLPRCTALCVASIHTCSCKSVTMWVKP